MTPGFTTPRQKKVTGESEHPCKSNESRILYVSMILPFGGFHHGGTPYSWMVFVRENPIYKWMMTGGYPHLWKTPIVILLAAFDVPSDFLAICYGPLQALKISRQG